MEFDWWYIIGEYVGTYSKLNNLRIVQILWISHKMVIILLLVARIKSKLIFGILEIKLEQ